MPLSLNGQRRLFSAILLPLVLAALPACKAERAAAPAPTVTPEPTSAERALSYYFVRYTDPSKYDKATDDAALMRCAEQPGANRGGADSTQPPAATILFKGSADEQAGVERCLLDLQNVSVLGPAQAGDPSPRVLRN
jgi:hypothetical protein